ncbi:formate dehydrogenase accessory sulfurtransferase FdhD [Aliiglaciecola lipolytica]|uniref:Sulfur carrier protein FdhD n=1 Tax=Aliiglaciecola lipolytica E3 TaxID=1127673 RepID=K6XX40_9ALTE|nr:formate dehydrogenase accessory sulfurtransferase FdhD [Aliiglaciecola lipolytica]GAC16216.1 FdhD protein [Aliiglaciecola lipolytica E3]
MSKVKQFAITRLTINTDEGRHPTLVSTPNLNSESAANSSLIIINQIDDLVTCEEPLEIWLKHPLHNAGNPKLMLTTLRSPGDDLDLVKGWLNASGLIEHYSEIYNVSHMGSQRIKGVQSNQVLITLHPQSNFDFASSHRHAMRHIDYVNSGCSVCGQQSIDVLLDKLPQLDADTHLVRPQMSVASIFSLADELKQAQSEFALTGGSHGAGLFSLPIKTDEVPRLIDVREDIGRHNALDKIIGAHLAELGDASNEQLEYGIVLSSRISFDLVQKAAMANIRFILAMGAPSSLAIELAQECDICLVGFIQQQRINIYTCAQRVS